MRESIRTLLAVAVLTAVVWVWADLELATDGSLDVPVEVTAPPDFLVRHVRPTHVTVKFKGPKGDIEDLKQTPDALVCRLTPSGSDLKTGRLVLRASDGFAHWDPYRLSILEIVDQEPGVPDGEILADLDRRVRLRVPVKPNIPGYTLSGQATVEPSEVAAVVAESDLSDLAEAKRYASAQLTFASPPRDLLVEREVTLESRLGGADGIEAVFDPPVVRITAQLESTVTPKTLAQLQILISGPPEMLNTYEVVFQEDADRFLDLKVEGPRQVVEPLTAQDVRVELVLAADDRPTSEGTWIPHTPKVIGLPVGVEVVGPLPTINFNLRRRTEPTPTP